VNESIAAIIGLAVLAGGGVIVIDAVVVRHIRRLAASNEPSDDVAPDREDRT
jgi:hypothetical protein